MMRKVRVFFLAVIMVLTFLPIPAISESSDVRESDLGVLSFHDGDFSFLLVKSSTGGLMRIEHGTTSFEVMYNYFGSKQGLKILAIDCQRRHHYLIGKPEVRM